MEKIKRLPDNELEVMLIIWRHDGAIHTGEILQKLLLRKPCNLQTVQSTLNRLLGKGFIHCEKIGRLNYYTPRIDETAYREQETETFLEQMYLGSPVKLMSALLSSEAMSDADIREIRRMLEKEGE